MMSQRPKPAALSSFAVNPATLRLLASNPFVADLPSEPNTLLTAGIFRMPIKSGVIATADASSCMDVYMVREVAA